MRLQNLLPMIHCDGARQVASFLLRSFQHPRHFHAAHRAIGCQTNLSTIMRRACSVTGYRFLA